ncbi:MAG: molybdopterin-guanine dinucleotide biosynthesis protein B [Crenarchaeota archaeon]|nr:molybdopterin-guanine dinucleotide biosynthesis protein B [Thermoproteota archaeon]MCR8463724.1 molybdopterin-guanine dinucleotide biosynthesis protein B [Thermoproteota archaeon]MCR8471264.1 molybdopterin-guanine dinucleotide biosynthesis protein B [Thermoproteota archaeon]MCR8472620.1 molybdopterin-guanine dinucleotide biosynthesis protein B [Thermoproteota archaeon]MCR8473738.1 molybdopterin-guanine dinucleotide biosynthesis protein B [Thermoproteota archaeon]
MKVISFIGRSSSGKTSLMEYLIRELNSRGFKVVAVKHIHKPTFDVDREGKDTWRLFNAGAETVIGASSERLYLFSRTKVTVDIDTLCNTIEILNGSVDFILVEGRLPYKRIKPWNVIVIGSDEHIDILQSLNDQTIAVVYSENFTRLEELKKIAKKPIIGMNQKAELLQMILHLK